MNIEKKENGKELTLILSGRWIRRQRLFWKRN